MVECAAFSIKEPAGKLTLPAPFLSAFDFAVDVVFHFALRVAKFRPEVNAHTEDTACIRECLRHIPQHTLRHITVYEKRDKRQHHPAHYHQCGGTVLNPFFCVCFHCPVK